MCRAVLPDSLKWVQKSSVDQWILVSVWFLQGWVKNDLKGHGTSIQVRKAYDVSNSFPLRFQTLLQLPFISWWIISSWVIVHRWVDANVWFRRYPDGWVSICQTPSLYIYIYTGFCVVFLDMPWSCSLSLSLSWFTHQRHKFHTMQHGPSD